MAQKEHLEILESLYNLANKIPDNRDALRDIDRTLTWIDSGLDNINDTLTEIKQEMIIAQFSTKEEKFIQRSIFELEDEYYRLLRQTSDISKKISQGDESVKQQLIEVEQRFKNVETFLSEYKDLGFVVAVRIK